MKLNTALKSLVLIVILLAPALAGRGGDAATGRDIRPASPVRLSDEGSKGVELAAKGLEVGRLSDEDFEPSSL